MKNKIYIILELSICSASILSLWRSWKITATAHSHSGNMLVVADTLSLSGRHKKPKCKRRKLFAMGPMGNYSQSVACGLWFFARLLRFVCTISFWPPVDIVEIKLYSAKSAKSIPHDLMCLCLRVQIASCAGIPRVRQPHTPNKSKQNFWARREQLAGAHVPGQQLRSSTTRITIIK